MKTTGRAARHGVRIREAEVRPRWHLALHLDDNGRASRAGLDEAGVHADQALTTNSGDATASPNAGPQSAASSSRRTGT